MLRCSECGKVFKHAKTIQENRGEFWGAPAYEDIGVCPFCGSDEIDWDYEGVGTPEDLEDEQADVEYEYYKSLQLEERCME